jgi:hypothetical protein
MKLYNIVIGEYFEATDYTIRGFLEGKRPHLFKEKPDGETHLDYERERCFSGGKLEDETDDSDDSVGEITINPGDSPSLIAKTLGEMFEDIGIDYESKPGGRHGSIKIVYQKEF